MHPKRWLAVAVLLCIAAGTAHGIITRHDRGDAKYLELGAKFPAVCAVGRAGEGTLVAPQWVVTAAHVAQGSSSSVVICDSGEYKIERKFVHPEWREGGPHDIALIHLAEAVKDAAPLELYRNTNEAGQAVVFVGRGDTGTGLTGPKIADHKKRAATNRVDEADNDWLYFQFDDPATPAATELEGISGPGDSGGPALLQVNGKYYVAGVSVWGSPSKNGKGTYGAREGYTRVSTNYNWLATTIGSAPQLAPAAQAAPQAAPAQAASVTIPDTPAGRRMAAWLPVIQRGDKDVISAFVRENFAKVALERMPAEERIKVHTNFFAETGGVKLHSVTKSEPNEVEIRAHAVKNGAWYRIALRVESATPNGILGFLFEEAPAPTGAPGTAPTEAAMPLPAGKLTDADIARDLEGFVNAMAAKDEFSGAVLIARDGKPIFQKAWGLASVRYNVPNRVDTKFNLGSMNKMFTAVAIAQLAEQGKLSFDDKVGKHLPDYPNKAVAEKVTIHQLLTHTSGLGSYWNAKYDATWPRIRTVKGFLDTLVDEPLLFEPGARFEYSNGGFIVLGAIIEKLSGMSYYDYVREKIFKPAGMNDTDSYEMDREVPNLATGYTNLGLNDRPEPGPRRSNIFLHSARGGPAGGGFSTVPDLLRFDVALRSGKLLGPKMTETLLTGRVSMGGPDMKYGYGFGVQTSGGKRIVGHNGGAPGINAWLDMYWEQGYTVAVLSNYDRAAGPVVMRAKALLTQN